MFERYTEKARRAIFFARYEASQFGSSKIETEHLLLGLLREDKALAHRFLRSPASFESIRKQIEARTTVREKVSTSVDMPLSEEGKRVLACAAEEADRLSHKHIATEHLLLGLLREEKCLAAEILQGYGLQLSTVREELSRPPSPPAASQTPLEEPPPSESAADALSTLEEELKQLRSERVASRLSSKTALLSEFSRDLTQAARANRLDPLVGREQELERVVHILCRRSKNNPVLIGEPGVGKAAVVKGLALRIASGNVPSYLADKRILALELSPILASARLSGQFEVPLRKLVRELVEARDAIAFMEELYTLRGTEGLLDAADILKPALSRGEIQCVGAATPADYRQSMEKEPWLERCFQSVKVPPPNEADAIKILFGIKDRYEAFHSVAYTDEALQYAVYHSNRYIPDRYLPDKAIDLIDEAGACVKLRQSALPEEVVEVQKRIKFVKERLENAIAGHELEKTNFYSNEERKARENFQRLREKYHLDESALGPPWQVTRQDIEEVLERWTGVSIKDEGTQGATV
jgi:ATP-dependent Clp protease ATP-binding subunit ClpC